MLLNAQKSKPPPTVLQRSRNESKHCSLRSQLSQRTDTLRVLCYLPEKTDGEKTGLMYGKTQINRAGEEEKIMR